MSGMAQRYSAATSSWRSSSERGAGTVAQVTLPHPRIPHRSIAFFVKAAKRASPQGASGRWTRRPRVCRMDSGGNAGRAEDLDAVLGCGGHHQLGGGRLQGRRREGEGRCGLGEGAHEAFEAGGHGDKEEAGLN